MADGQKRTPRYEKRRCDVCGKSADYDLTKCKPVTLCHEHEAMAGYMFDALDRAGKLVERMSRSFHVLDENERLRDTLNDPGVRSETLRVAARSELRKAAGGW